jgi:hypothetical protein
MDKKIGMLVGIAIAIFLVAIVAINMAIKQFEAGPKVTQQQLPVKKQAVIENKIIPPVIGQKRILEPTPEVEAPIAPGEPLLQ